MTEFNKNCLEKFKNADFDVLRNLIRIYLHTDNNDDLWVSDVVGNLWPLTKECFMGYYLKNSEDQYYDLLIKKIVNTTYIYLKIVNFFIVIYIFLQNSFCVIVFP